MFDQSAMTDNYAHGWAIESPLHIMSQIVPCGKHTTHIQVKWKMEFGSMTGIFPLGGKHGLGEGRRSTNSVLGSVLQFRMLVRLSGF